MFRVCVYQYRCPYLITIYLDIQKDIRPFQITRATDSLTREHQSIDDYSTSSTRSKEYQWKNGFKLLLKRVIKCLPWVRLFTPWGKPPSDKAFVIWLEWFAMEYWWDRGVPAVRPARHLTVDDNTARCMWISNDWKRKEGAVKRRHSRHSLTIAASAAPSDRRHGALHRAPRARATSFLCPPVSTQPARIGVSRQGVRQKARKR